jgi:tellurite resistance-related uncharacterized protein
MNYWSGKNWMVGKDWFSAYTPAGLWWPLGVKSWEIAFSAPQVVAERLTRLAAAGIHPGARDRREFTLMGQEKFEAYAEALNAMAVQMMEINQKLALHAMQQWWNAWAMAWLTPGGFPMGMAKANAAIARNIVSASQGKRLESSVSQVANKGIAPVHRRVTGNARRLRRVK